MSNCADPTLRDAHKWRNSDILKLFLPWIFGSSADPKRRPMGSCRLPFLYLHVFTFWTLYLTCILTYMKIMYRTSQCSVTIKSRQRVCYTLPLGRLNAKCMHSVPCKAHTLGLTMVNQAMRSQTMFMPRAMGRCWLHNLCTCLHAFGTYMHF